MGGERLRRTLAELHAELEGSASLDAEARAMLRAAAEEIERTLDAGEPLGGEPMTERLAAAARHFEATHPRVSEAVQRVLDALAALGI